MTETYTIPAPLAAALGSGRGNIFATLFINEIDNGHEVPVEQVKEIIRLVGDLIDQNHALNTAVQRINDNKDYITDLLDEIDTIKTKLEEVRNDIGEEIAEWCAK